MNGKLLSHQRKAHNQSRGSRPAEEFLSVLPSDLPNDEPGFDPLASLRAVRKYRWISASVFVAVISLTMIWTIGQPRIYEASSTVDIEQSTPQILGSTVQDVVTLAPGNYWFSKEY